MKFKDLPSGEIFTWWEHDKHRTAIKIGERGTSERERAVCLDTGEFIDIHANKDVKEVESIPETSTLKFGRNGQAFLCSPISGGKVLAQRVLLVGGEIMDKSELKDGKQANHGEHPENAEQVYIMWKLAEKKLAELEKVLSVVGIMIQDGLSPSVSDNKIMSTPQVFIGRSLTE